MTLLESPDHSKDIPQYLVHYIWTNMTGQKKVKMQQYFGLTLAKRRNGQTTGTCMMAKGSFSRGQVTQG